MPIFDTHAHYDSGAFNADRDGVLAALPAAGVTLVVNPGCDLESSRQAVALAERFPHVYAAVGIHPSDCGGCGETEFEELKALCRHEKVVAIGEIGLDYYWQDNPPREFQQMVFRRQIELALALDLPLFAPTHYAWGVTSIMLPAGVDGDKLLKVAADECGIVFAGGQDHYKGRMVRFGHMGWVDWADALAGLHALVHGLRASGGFSASRDYLETALSAYHRALDVEPGRVIPDVRS